MRETENPQPPAGYAPARFGRAGTKIHYGATSPGGSLITSVPLCGTYTRPGSGFIFPGMEVTCQKCLEAAKC